MLTSRLAARYQDRFLAFAFLANGYMAPDPNFDYHKVMERNKQLFGNEILGYWASMDAEDAEQFALEHVCIPVLVSELSDGEDAV